MAFNQLNDDSGGTAEDRRAEAWRILEILKDCHALGQLTHNERQFVDKVAQGFSISVNQLFYLREIKARTCE
jgi:hypothetical protein